MRTINLLFRIGSLYAGMLPVLLFPLSVKAQQTPPVLLMKPVISTGLSGPIQVLHAGDGSQRLFVVQKAGSVKVFDRADDENFTDRGLFVDITGIPAGGEQGLLSMAFDPGYATNGYFYLYFTNPDGNLELARYQVSTDPYRADAGSKLTILVIPHPGQSNHNGGELHFGTDGLLYLSTGDGGGAGDTGNNSQNTNSLLGKLLRIDVAGATQAAPFKIPAGNPYGNAALARGLRNPFRWSFDRETGDAWIGDVGQGSREEIDFVAAGALADVNFGWRCYEGELPYNTTNCGPQSSYHAPVHTYTTGTDGNSVIGGVVYRGNGFPSLKGYYIGADFYNQNLHLIRRVNNTFETTTSNKGIASTSDFGESENGELYASNLAGNTVYRVTVDPSSLPVTLISFSVDPGGEGALLEWETSSEKEFDRFEVQYSVDARNFVTIGTVEGKAEDGLGARYTFSYAQREWRAYYRLKMVDLDGSATYSAIAAFSLLVAGSEASAGEQRFYILPNAITGSQVSLDLPEPFDALELVNVQGQRIRKSNLGGRTGKFQIDVGAVPPGVYIARFTGPGKIAHQKVVFAD